MIVKMKFLSITGPKADIDRVVNEYLSKYEIHLENALSELKDVKNLRPYMEINPYRKSLEKADAYTKLVTGSPSGQEISLEEALELLKDLDGKLTSIEERRASLASRLEELKKSLRDIEPFVGFDYNIHRVLQFTFIKYRFGRIAKEYYEKFEKFIYDSLDAVFFKCHSDDSYVWGVYFVPSGLSKKLDAVLSSMHFEQVYMPDSYNETPEHAAARLNSEIQTVSQQAAACRSEASQLLQQEKEKLFAARERLSSLSTGFDVRSLAACTTQESQSFYILCGWMSEEDAAAFEKEVAEDKDLYCIIEDDHHSLAGPPPTKLKNPRLFKPLEMVVRMYGLPSYNEIDPTVFVGLTYACIFGAMFGDVGQGLCLLIGGGLLWHFRKLDLAAIISRAGFFSTIFGFLYGSFFGFEDVLPALWLKPTESMTTLPFIGRLNTAFAVAVAFGMFLILTSMILHIVNAVKAKDTENTWFDANGLAGFVFYAAVTAVLFLFMTGNPLPAGAVLTVMFVIPLVLVAMKEPLTRLVEHKKEALPAGKAMFFAQTFFEMFEVLLSYFSNTLSFIRIGAFAVSHAAMMQVVLMLAGAENGGSPNWLIVILGNLFVSGMEGLIVGIQVLRLEYYEMFSRFYKGNGREFQPLARKKIQN